MSSYKLFLKKQRIRPTCFKVDSRAPSASQRKRPTLPTSLTREINQIIDFSCCPRHVIGQHSYSTALYAYPEQESKKHQ